MFQSMTGADQLARMLEGSELQQMLRCSLQPCYCDRSLKRFPAPFHQRYQIRIQKKVRIQLIERRIPLSNGMQQRQQRMDRD